MLTDAIIFAIDRLDRINKNGVRWDSVFYMNDCYIEKLI